MTIILVSILAMILIFQYFQSLRRNIQSKNTVISRFRNKLKGNNRLRARLAYNLSNSLMVDPDSNINLGDHDNENQLREKADIHRARLNKYGHSKINGEVLYLGPKGGVYKFTAEGKKKYI